MIGERIKEVRQAVGKTQQEFADSIGLKRNTVATYEMGKATPSDRTIGDISRVFHVSESWLRTGDGEMFIKQEPDDELAYVFAQIKISDDDLIKKIIKTYWSLDEKEKAVIRKLIDGLQYKSPPDRPGDILLIGRWTEQFFKGLRLHKELPQKDFIFLVSCQNLGNICGSWSCECKFVLHVDLFSVRLHLLNPKLYSIIYL